MNIPDDDQPIDDEDNDSTPIIIPDEYTDYTYDITDDIQFTF